MATVDQGRIDAGPCTRLTPGTATRVACGDRGIALVNDRGTFYAVADVCLRCGHPVSEGALDNGLLTCAHCGWRYELERGCVAGLPGLWIETHPTTVEAGHVFIDPHERVGSYPSG